MIAGDAALVEADADQIASAARRLDSAVDTIERDATTAVASWHGRSSETAFRAIVLLANRTRVSSEILRRSAAVLRDYAVELRAAQWAAVDAQVALDRLQADRDALGPLTTDTARRRLLLGPHLHDAEQRLEQARRRALDANRDAASRIQALVGDLVAIAPPSAHPSGQHHGVVGTVLHTGLDLLGLVPVFGEPADALNALIYAFEGDKLDAGLSMAGTVPIAGWAATGGKLTREGLDAARTLDHGVEATVDAAAAARAAHRVGKVMPGAERAVADPRKFTAYALNPLHTDGAHKARVFKATTGFDLKTADELERQVMQGVREQPAILGKADDRGQRFTVDIPVKGPTGSAIVRTGWMVGKDGDGVPALTTLFVR